MDQQNTATSPANGATTPHDLFVLTDEQILEIEPQHEVASDEWRMASESRPPVISSEARNPSPSDQSGDAAESRRDSSVASPPRNDGIEQGATNAAATEHVSRVTGHDSTEPPTWLTAQMKDPRSGTEARELWNGVLQARQEAAAYRAAFATPEDARALKELYPGGVSEARAAASRAHLLEEIDRSYFGTSGAPPQQTAAARAQLAAMMLHEDPAAFREMVFAGLRALEAAEKGSASPVGATNLPRLAQVFVGGHASPEETRNSKSETRNSPDNLAQPRSESSSKFDFRVSTDGQQSPVTSHESLVSAYAAFEKSANEDLERTVGVAITRTLEQALPNLARMSNT